MAPGPESKILIESETRTGAGARLEVNILCLDLTGCSPAVQFCTACGAVFVFYLAYGYYLELVFASEDVKDVSLYITLVQFLFTSAFSYIESVIRSKMKRKVPLKTYALLAALTLGTMAFSNLALSYLNYPTQLIFKSCKLIPVMIGSILIQGRKYGCLDYLAAIIMCGGLTMFTLADSKTSPNFHVTGVIIIMLALVCDAVIGNVQEKIMKQFQATNNEVVFYSYAIASVYLFVFTLATGTLVSGFKYCMQDFNVMSRNATAPVVKDALHLSSHLMYGNILMLSVCGYAGLQAVLSLVRVCGAPAAVTVTTMRKALSIVFSFLLFSKPFVFQYAWSGGLVVLAVYLNLFSKKHPNYTPAVVGWCCQHILHFYQSEYRLLQSRTKYYTDNV